MFSVCLFLFALILHGNRCSLGEERNASNPIELSRNTLKEALTFLTAAPHPMGSARQSVVRAEISQRLKKFGWNVEIDPFVAKTPNPLLLTQPSAPAPLTIEKDGANLYATRLLDKKCVIALGTHYDTKHFSNFSYVGANDSGSSTAGLIALAESLQKKSDLQCDIELWFFDGEESVLENWFDGEQRHPAKLQDNTYGSRHLANQLESCAADTQKKCRKGREVRALILLDMIGSKNLSLSLDTNSNPQLTERLIDLAAKNKMSHLISKRRAPIEDDHIPFIKRGIPAINLIDFNNLDFWHKDGDVESTISFESIEKATQLAFLLAEDLM